MAKTEDKAPEHEEEAQLTKWKAGAFLLDEKGAKVHIEATGDASAIDDFKIILKSLYEDGFQPDGKSPAEKAAPAAGKSGGSNPEKKPCPIHEGHSLFRKTNAKGTWYSHKNPDGDGYCNGKEG